MPRRGGRARLSIATFVGAAACVDGQGIDVGSVDVDLDDAPAAAASYTGTLSLLAETLVSSDGASWWLLGATPETPPNQTGVARADGSGPLLSAGPRLVTVALQRSIPSTRLNAGALLPPGTYRHVRLVVYSGAFAVVTGTVGTTIVAGDSVVIHLERPLLIQREVAAVTLPRNGRLSMTWDLNSERWLTPAAIAAHRADSAAVRDAAAVVLR